MRVNDAARSIGVSPDLIRKLERRGLIVIPRDHNGHRRLTPEHIELLRRVVFPERREEPRR